MSPAATAAVGSAGLIDRYETLRSNALGQLNGPCGSLTFLKGGMAGWLRAFSGNSAEQPASRSSSRVRPAEANGGGLISILADAVLDANGPAISGDDQ